MDKLISQQTAIEVIKKRMFETAFNNAGAKQDIDETLMDVAENRLENWFDEMPSVQSDMSDYCDRLWKLAYERGKAERKTGHWIAITSRNNTYKCSVCGRLLVNITDGKNKVAKNYPYCHCGAKMEGGEQE